MAVSTLAVGSDVVVKKPNWLPIWVARYFDKRFGEMGVVVGIDVGTYSGNKLYSIYIEKLDAVGCYFNEQLTTA